MKNIEQILKDAGVEVTAEQLSAVNTAVGENYRTVNDYNKQKKALETAESDRDNAKQQLDTANATLEKFKDIDPDKIADEIATYKKAAEDAKAEAEKSITARDQKDFLKAEFDRLGIESERTRKSLMADIMGDDGLKWKDGKFMGLDDYLKSENEKDHFYKTQEEKELEEKQQGAAGKVPKFTDVSQGKSPQGEAKNPFNFNFTPVREVKK